ncbi:PREDICTED: uncharacterized protein LOC108663311 isoform X1 [Theobroma cacao]|uniref:Uncharacterized protein LOC108663311 isoform X1 n=1 Tax=Theobroma cacao TaxID=3641 RepID=A0AB32WRV9_THECC|nr:PREDICTED: uncharacterized protein LOC108663311 isoform X1 [Theobroma cacao]
MKRKRERKNRERRRAKRMVLLHFEEGKREFLLQFWRKKKAKNFEKIGAICCRKIRAVCCQFVQKNCAKKLELFATNLCRKLDSFVLPILRSFVTENLPILEQKMRFLVTDFERKGREKAIMMKRGSHGGEKRKPWW